MKNRPMYNHVKAMKNKTIYSFIISCFLAVFPAKAQQHTVWTPDNGDGTFSNPILWGDWADPDVMRVGDTFYMVSTSMQYVPGCPILKSNDLVNWEMAGYAVERYDEDPRYDMKGGTLYMNGSWAATIRHHNGKYYVGFCTPDGWGREKGNFSICIADKPEGPWERTIFPEFMYDPGLLFDDDGKVYVVHGQGTLYVTELNADAKSVKGKPVKIWEKRFKNAHEFGGGFGMEGSHAYKINGKYYITCPAGGSHGWQICLRSDNIYGPYEHKLIMNDDHTYPQNGFHQGGMVQLKNGDWWFIIMQDRGGIGRVPNLVPVTWTDGWPMLGDNGRDVITYKKPDTGKKSPIKVPATSDEFNKQTLGLQWQWNHNPKNSMWSLKERKGFMRLKAMRADSLLNARNTLTQRVQGPSSTGTVVMDVRGMKDGNIAGFGIWEMPYAYVGIHQNNGKRSIVMCNHGRIIEEIKDFTGERIWIRARATDRNFKANLYYSLDGESYHLIGNDLYMKNGLRWTGNRFALFNYSTTEEGVGGYVDFDWFHFIGK